jgi:hypothetical protein
MRALAAGIAGMLALALAGPASAHEGSGGIGTAARSSIRALAMGETGVVATGNPADFPANPALLASIPAAGITLGYSDLIEGMPASRTWVCAGLPLGSEVTLPDVDTGGRRFGLGISVDHSGVELSQGTDWALDLVSIGAAFRLTPYACLGLAGGYLFSNSDLEGSGMHAFAADLGAFVEMTSTLNLAVSLRNVVGTTRWEDGDDEPVPFAACLGAGVLLPLGVSGHLTFTYTDRVPAKVGLGVDAPIGLTGLSLRGGYLYHTGDYSRGIISAGFGYGYNDFNLDYAVKLDDELALGTTHHIALGYTFP